MAYVSEMPQCQELKMLLHKAQEADSIVAAWPDEEIDNHLCEMAQEIKIFPNKKQLEKKLARENNVTFHDGKPVTVISQGTSSRESVIFIHSMFEESERNLSFLTHRWPSTAPVTASVLAKAGFYYFGVDDTVQCFSCNGRINNWSPGDTAMGEHKRIYPRCEFVRGIDTKNVPARKHLQESRQQSTKGKQSPNSGKSSTSEDEAGCSDDHLSDLLKPLNLEESEPPSEAKSYFTKEINRLLSFKIWPISNHVDRFDLAAAGFYCVNESNGTVQCFACFGRLSEWKAGDRPKSEHLRLFPSCPFILGRPTGNVPLTPTEKDQAVRFFSSSSSCLSRPLQIASNLSQSERYGLQGQSSSSRGSSVNLGRTAALPEPADLTVKYAKYPNNAYEQARLETYGRWPNDHSQIPANLARAGFFATGNADEVKCFYCGGGLKDWSIGEEAWEEHARWFIRCEWLLQQTGPAFVDAVQRKFRPSGHPYFEPNMGIAGDENAILPPTPPPAPPSTGQEQASAAKPEPRPAEQRKMENENKRQTWKKQPDKKKQGKKNKPVSERVEELFQSDVAQFMVDMGQDETLIKTVLRKRLESGQSPYQTSEELLMAIFEEEVGQKAGAVSSVPAEEPASPKKNSNERKVSPDQEIMKDKPRDSSRKSPKMKEPDKCEGRSKLGKRRRFQLAPNFEGISSDVEDPDVDHEDDRDDEKEDPSDGDVGDGESITLLPKPSQGSGQRNLERGEWLQNSTEFVRNSNDDDLLESNNKRNNTENQHIVQEESDGSCKSSETAESKSEWLRRKLCHNCRSRAREVLNLPCCHMILCQPCDEETASNYCRNFGCIIEDRVVGKYTS